MSYFISATLFGNSLYFIKILSLVSVTLFGRPVYTVWKNKESENKF